jgi:hypothetical protein
MSDRCILRGGTVNENAHNAGAQRERSALLAHTARTLAGSPDERHTRRCEQSAARYRLLTSKQAAEQKQAVSTKAGKARFLGFSDVAVCGNCFFNVDSVLRGAAVYLLPAEHLIYIERSMGRL